MISFSNSYRSTQVEIMDDFNLQGKDMQEVVLDLERVNLLLGGNKITFQGIVKLLKGENSKKELVLMDIGCGDGAILRNCVRLAKRQGIKIVGIGLDANPYILEEARKRSIKYPSLSFKKIDVFSEELKKEKFDIAICTLFTHHFTNKEIIQFLEPMVHRASIGVVVNDLHRSKWAFQLFKVFATIFLKTKIARHDGLVSVASGFKKRELQKISNAMSNVDATIQWKWAFRFQWILKRREINAMTKE